jgi:hypothetical protein
MIVRTSGFEFQFPDAIDAFVFDETDKSKPTFHGAPMKAVDIIAEFTTSYIFVEIKEFPDTSSIEVTNTQTNEARTEHQNRYNRLKDYLKYKYRDSYLYRHAEHKVEKPIHYICLLNLENAQNSKIQKDLKQELPVAMVSNRWLRSIVESCQVVNYKNWNRNFPMWSLSRLEESGDLKNSD